MNLFQMIEQKVKTDITYLYLQLNNTLHQMHQSVHIQKQDMTILTNVCSSIYRQ